MLLLLFDDNLGMRIRSNPDGIEYFNFIVFKNSFYKVHCTVRAGVKKYSRHETNCQFIFVEGLHLISIFCILNFTAIKTIGVATETTGDFPKLFFSLLVSLPGTCCPKNLNSCSN